MTPREFTLLMGKLESGFSKSVYVLLSDDEYLQKRLVSKFRSLTLLEGIEELNFDVFDSENLDMSRFQDTVETLPMMAPYRLVILRGIEDLGEGQQQILVELLKRPVETTILVLTSKKLDRRKRFFKELGQHTEFYELKSPYENQLSQWTKYLAEEKGKNWASGAQELFHNLVGIKLIDLDNELNKLVSHIGQRKTIEVTDVESVVSRAKLDSVFDLATSIGCNNRTQALLHLAHLLDQGHNEIGALALVSRHLRILWNLKEGQHRGLRSAQLATHAGIPPYFLNSYLEQTRLWSFEKLKEAFEMLLETDRAIKSSPLASHIWLENFILKTCSPAQAQL